MMHMFLLYSRCDHPFLQQPAAVHHPCGILVWSSLTYCLALRSEYLT